MEHCRSWPVRPAPQPLECFSSWLFRTSKLYQISVAGLLKEIGLPASDTLDIDTHVEPQALAALAYNSRVKSERLSAMSLGHFVQRARFSDYIYGFRVLPLVSEPGMSELKLPVEPWLPSFRHPPSLICPLCLAQDDIPYLRLTWQHRLVTTCPLHEIRLVEVPRYSLDNLDDWLPQNEIKREEFQPILQLDRMTNCALSSGKVRLAKTTVSAAWWLQFLRALIDELARAEEHYLWGFQCSPIYARIWLLSGHTPPRRSQADYCFEDQDIIYRQRIFRSAAVAITMIMSGELVPVLNPRMNN